MLWTTAVMEESMYPYPFFSYGHTCKAQSIYLMVACRSTGVVSSISVFLSRIEKFPEYLLYRVSLFSVNSRFHPYSDNTITSLSLKTNLPAAARSCHYCEQQTSWPRSPICHSGTRKEATRLLDVLIYGVYEC